MNGLRFLGESVGSAGVGLVLLACVGNGGVVFGGQGPGQKTSNLSPCPVPLVSQTRRKTCEGSVEKRSLRSQVLVESGQMDSKAYSFKGKTRTTRPETES